MKNDTGILRAVGRSRDLSSLATRPTRPTIIGRFGATGAPGLGRARKEREMLSPPWPPPNALRHFSLPLLTLLSHPFSPALLRSSVSPALWPDREEREREEEREKRDLGAYLNHISRESRLPSSFSRRLFPAARSFTATTDGARSPLAPFILSLDRRRVGFLISE